MGDAEPPSKKRAAGRELSRDNPGLDDDDEEVFGQETGTFKRASDEVLANRRIVRVKRNQTSSTPSAPSSNPFAAIRLVPPTNHTPIPAFNNISQETVKPAFEKAESPSSVNKRPDSNNDDDDVKQLEETKESDDNTPASEKENGENKDTLVENYETTPAAEKENDERKNELEGNDENTLTAEKENGENKNELVGNEENTHAAKKDDEEKKDRSEENDENTPASGSVNSFQQLSSSQNAFTGIVGTGFSSSTFSFGSITKTPTFPSLSFGTNGNSSLFGDPNKTEGTKILSMQEVHVETGEENEQTVFTADSALYEFLDGGWKERGKGEVKVNVLTSGTQKARLVMRARGNYRLILNASIFPDMKLTNMDKKGITFACVNSAGDSKDGLSTFALKFKDGSIVEEFREVVMAHKGNLSAPTLRAPENSPKGSAD